MQSGFSSAEQAEPDKILRWKKTKRTRYEESRRKEEEKKPQHQLIHSHSTY